jgi:hypothetical protein
MEVVELGRHGEVGERGAKQDTFAMATGIGKNFID